MKTKFFILTIILPILLILAGCAKSNTSSPNILPANQTNNQNQEEPLLNNSANENQGLGKIYLNGEYGYTINYPDASTLSSSDNFPQINLPFATGTNMTAKYLIMATSTPVNGLCENADLNYTNKAPEPVKVNNYTFNKQEGEDAAMSHRYVTISYSTQKPNTELCVNLNFNYTYAILDVYSPETRPQEFNLEQETAVFNQMVNTFRFLE